MRLATAAVLGFLFLAIVLGAAVQIDISRVEDISNDQTSQNETPVAVNPLNNNNIITGANDWNYNDGCADRRRATATLQPGDRLRQGNSQVRPKASAFDGSLLPLTQWSGHRGVQKGDRSFSG